MMFVLYPPERKIRGAWAPQVGDFEFKGEESVPEPIATVVGEPGEVSVVTVGTASFTYSPPEAQTMWLIPHNLSMHPSVTVVDGLGRVVIPDIRYLSNQLVELTFAFPESGYAYLN